MTTQAVISLVKKDHTFIKIVCGCNGHNAEKLVKIIKDCQLEKIQNKIKDIYKIALENKFGCRECLVVMDNENIVFKGHDELEPLYRETFDNPSFNPRWKSGMADSTTILKIDNPEWIYI
jgi:hypothetical protein